MGPLSGPAAREMAGVLACGPQAFVARDSAASLWNLLAPPEGAHRVDVVLRSPHRRRRPGVRVVCAPDLAADEVTHLHGVPITTPARTVLDLAGCVRPRRLEQAFARGEREGLTSPDEVSRILARHPGCAGAAALRTLIGRGQLRFVRSELEERVLELFVEVDLPIPQTNVRIGRDEVDLFWPAHGLAAEIDGFAFHRTRPRFVHDRRKRARLMAQGLIVLTYSYEDVMSRPSVMLVQIARHLERAERAVGRPALP